MAFGESLGEGTDKAVAGKAGRDLVFELATGASEISSGRLDTTKTTGHTSGREEIP